MNCGYIATSDMYYEKSTFSSSNFSQLWFCQVSSGCEVDANLKIQVEIQVANSRFNSSPLFQITPKDIQHPI